MRKGGGSVAFQYQPRDWDESGKVCETYPILGLQPYSDAQGRQIVTIDPKSVPEGFRKIKSFWEYCDSSTPFYFWSSYRAHPKNHVLETISPLPSGRYENDSGSVASMGGFISILGTIAILESTLLPLALGGAFLGGVALPLVIIGIVVLIIGLAMLGKAYLDYKFGAPVFKKLEQEETVAV